ncbi:MAG: nitroreductase family protein [bacterium]
MSFLDLVRKRQSVRRYSNKPVERRKIERCLQAARLAPSTCNSQPWRFIVVDDPQLKDAIARETFGKVLSFNRFCLEAPALIIVITQKGNITSRIGGVIKNKRYNLIDVGIAAEHFCLQAAEEELGTCMLGWFNEEAVKKVLNIPEQKRIDLIIALGYPESAEIRPKKRKEMALIRNYNRYE